MNECTRKNQAKILQSRSHGQKVREYNKNHAQNCQNILLNKGDLTRPLNVEGHFNV